MKIVSVISRNFFLQAPVWNWFSLSAFNVVKKVISSFEIPWEKIKFFIIKRNILKNINEKLEVNLDLQSALPEP